MLAVAMDGPPSGGKLVSPGVRIHREAHEAHEDRNLTVSMQNLNRRFRAQINADSRRGLPLEGLHSCGHRTVR
jgi:hypothetical protein